MQLLPSSSTQSSEAPALPPRVRPVRTADESRLARSAWSVLIARVVEVIAALEVPVQKALLARYQLGIISEKYHANPTFLLGHRTATGARVPVSDRPTRRLAFAPVENLKLYAAFSAILHANVQPSRSDTT